MSATNILAKIAAKADSSKEVTKDEAAEKLAPKKDGSYKSLRLRSLIKHNGLVVLPNAEGIFVPADAEEAEMLAYFASKSIGYVEAL